MPKKLQPSELEKIIGVLPVKEQQSLRQQDINPAWLQENIARCKGLLRRDLWVGLTWFVAYSAALFVTKFSSLTITIFVFGVIYFIFTIFKTGSFGLNRKRVQVFEQLLNQLTNGKSF
ncbi:MAG: hypothetical protein HY842_07740 [Bacteroidetes bacterium]|nr:hypothetical protein [Bacteroidota bacterium]